MGADREELGTDRERAAVERRPGVARERAATGRRSTATDATPPAGARAAGKKGKMFRGPLGAIIEIVVIVGAAFVIALLAQAFLIKPFTIHQTSMQPTLLEGDRILINRLSYHFRDPKPGDIVVFHSPLAEDEDLVKRVVAVEGDRLSISDGTLFVNGVAQDEPYLANQDFGGELKETVVPQDMVFVMGDNRDESGDSRAFGAVSTDSLIGCAFCVYWPIGHWKGL